MATGKANVQRISLRPRAQHRFVYSGLSALVTAPNGALDATTGTGFYAAGTRILSRLEWFCDGQPLQPFAFSPVGHDTALLYAQLPGSEQLSAHSPYSEVSLLQAEISFFVGAALHVRALRNFAHAEAAFTLELVVDADFAGTSEAIAGIRKQQAPVRRALDAEQRELRFT